jgi:hypothetical protein
MTPEQQAAYINSQVACMLAELEAMKARNALTQSLGLSQVYSEADFLALPDKHGVHHNAVIGYFTGR